MQENADQYYNAFKAYNNIITKTLNTSSFT